MSENAQVFYFVCSEKDSLYTLEYMRDLRGGRRLSEVERRQLACMERREEEGRIYLIPAAVYAAANQEKGGRWLKGADEKLREKWYEQGVAWMRRHPAFLEKFGWKERRSAIYAAGILSRAEEDPSPGNFHQVRRLLNGTWRYAADRIKSVPYLDAAVWNELRAPWGDSGCMSSAMSGVLLLMAALQDRAVYDRDQLWPKLRRLRDFTARCLEAPERAAGARTEDAVQEEERLEWLSAHFINPQHPAYIREKGRLGSEWLEQLYQVMDIAGLPLSACETMRLSRGEMLRLLDAMQDGLKERQYMTFLVLYAVSRELVSVGRAAGRAAVTAERPE